VDSGATRNHISPATIKRMGLPYRQKENPYPLVTISGNPILYRDGMIHFKTGPIKVIIEEQEVVISFNILLLGKDKAVLGMPFLQKFNPKINWSIGIVELGATYTEAKKKLSYILKRYHKYKKLWNK